MKGYNLYSDINDYKSNILIELIDVDELIDLELHKKILLKIIHEGDIVVLKKLFNKSYSILIFLDEYNRMQLIELYHKYINIKSFKNLEFLLRDTEFGNLLYLYKFIIENIVINVDNINSLDFFKQFPYILDEDLLNYIPNNKKLFLHIDERIEKFVNSIDVSYITKLIETMFFYNMLIVNKSFADSFLVLYNYCNDVAYKNKGELINIIMKRELTDFFYLLNKYMDNIDWNKSRFIENYDKLFEHFIKLNVPLFFDYINLEFNGKVTNNNLYYMLYVDRTGTKNILSPFKSIDINEVQKIYDIHDKIFITPHCYIGEIPVNKISSFVKINEINKINSNILDTLKSMYEDEIEAKIRPILEDLDITPHGPTEKIDVWTHKLCLDNDQDMRRSGIIIKGKSYEDIKLGDVINNIVKAVILPIDLIILIYVGNLHDESRNHFISQCNAFKKMYAFIDRVDLTKIFMAYNLLNENKN